MSMKIHSPYFKKQYDLSKSQLIGEGNFAQVFRIFDSQLNDSLAIRRVKKSQSDMQDITKQKVINQELKKVQNSNILKIYDIIDMQQAVWYITEYCSGGSLWDVLNLCKDNKMNEKECLQCVLQISKGVQELHNHRITHRDLKPENILLKTKYITGRQLPLVKLADFGLSTQKIIMQTIAGTKQYIAPQQAKFHNYTNAVDVWSLGIICDEILHGTPFYSGQNNKEVFNKILKTPYKVRDQSIRQSIKNFLVSLLKKKPYERPIIAVIRKTIQKILQQIESQNPNNKNSKLKRGNSKDQSLQSIRASSSINATNGSKYVSLLESRRLQKKPVNLQVKKQLSMQTHSNLKTPRQQQKRQISGRKVEFMPKPKQQQKRQLTKQLKKQLKSQQKRQQKIQEKRQQKKSQYKQQKRQQKKQQKKQSLIAFIYKKPRNSRMQSPKNQNQKSQKSIRSHKHAHSGIASDTSEYNMTERSDTKNEKINLNNKKDIPQKHQIRTQAKSDNKNQIKVDLTKSQAKSIVFNSKKSEINTPISQKLQSSTLMKSVQNPQIIVYKPQRKRQAPLIKKEQFLKSSSWSVTQYIQGLQLSKVQLMQRTCQLKLTQKSPSFLPNTALSSSEIKVSVNETGQVMQQFKKQYDLLNYVRFDDDYDMKLYIKNKQLYKNKLNATKQLHNIKDKLKHDFFRQLDAYVDGFVERHLK